MSDESLAVIAALELLRRADQPLRLPELGRAATSGGGSRMLRQPGTAMEVMETDPPCVIVRGAEYAEPSTERTRWQGVGRGG